ncbi:MAG: DNA lyase [Dietzia sp.]|nr:DNA lyase [Dietzia sp.]
MRLWSIHPDLLDRAALIAGWREGLLAQKVLRGLTKGYRAHPQLERFRTLPDPVAGIATWLHGLADAADARGYRFDRTRVVLPPGPERLPLTDGQLALEWAHLRAKVIERDPPWLDRLVAPRPHPMFDLIPGPVAAWERAGLPEE